MSLPCLVASSEEGTYGLRRVGTENEGGCTLLTSRADAGRRQPYVLCRPTRLGFAEGP